MNAQKINQLIRYVLVGMASNAAGYMAYLLLTHFVSSPMVAVTVVYLVIASLSFLGNRKITFAHEGGMMRAGVRYIFAQLLGYGINLGMLLVFVDICGYDHRLVQAAAVVVVAGYLFISLKYCVFRESR